VLLIEEKSKSDTISYLFELHCCTVFNFKQFGCSCEAQLSFDSRLEKVRLGCQNVQKTGYYGKFSRNLLNLAMIDRFQREEIAKQFLLPERQSKIDTLLKQDGQAYCICRSSDSSRFMIACDACEEW
jgi:hypothetical protein